METVQRGLGIFNDICGQDIGAGETVQIGEGLVLDPEDIQTVLVPFQDVLRGKTAPAAIGVCVLVVGFLAVEAVFGMIAGYEILQIPFGQGILLQGEVDVGTEVVNPDLFRLHFRAGRTFVEGEHICLDTGLVEDTGGQTEDGVQIGGFQKLFADDFPCAALKKHIVRQNHSSLSGGFQNGFVLNDVAVLPCFCIFMPQ